MLGLLFPMPSWSTTHLEGPAQRVRASLGQNKGLGRGACRRVWTWHDFFQCSVYDNGREELSVETLTQPELSRVGAGVGLQIDRDTEGLRDIQTETEREGQRQRLTHTHTVTRVHTHIQRQHGPWPTRSPTRGLSLL